MLLRLSLLRFRVNFKTSSRNKLFPRKISFQNTQQNVDFGTFIAFWMLSLDCPNFYLINLSAIFAPTTVYTGTIWKIWGYLLGPGLSSLQFLWFCMQWGYLLGPGLSSLQFLWFCMQAGLSPRCCQLRDTAALRCIVGKNKPRAIHVRLDGV